MRELLRFCADPWREERTQPPTFPGTEFEQPGRTQTTPFASSECQVTAVHFFQGRLNSTRRPNRATLQVLETSRCSSKVAWRVGERKPCFIAETTSQGVIPHAAFCAQPATEHTAQLRDGLSYQATSWEFQQLRVNCSHGTHGTNNRNRSFTYYAPRFDRGDLEESRSFGKVNTLLPRIVCITARCALEEYTEELKKKNIFSENSFGSSHIHYVTISNPVASSHTRKSSK